MDGSHACTRSTRSRSSCRRRPSASAVAAADCSAAASHQPLSFSPPPAGPRAAVVATVKGFGQLAESWCAYHLAIGFAHLYVYFDDAEEADALDLGARFPADRLTAVKHDAALRRAWRALPASAELMRHEANEVQVRQQLNARHALGLAVAARYDWLLHIDADELFHPGAHGGRADAPSHFAALERYGVSTFCYMNHEAIPERHGIGDPFREVTLFKRPLDLIQRSAAAAAAVDFWQARHDGCFFYYYDNGKAAVRVSTGATTLSVHEWLPSPKGDGLQNWYSNLRSQWAGRGQLGDVVKHMAYVDASILHYPVCSVEALWGRWRRGIDNYRLKGEERPPPFHEHVSAAAQRAFERSGLGGAREAVRTLFEAKVMLADDAERERQLEARVCERVCGPAEALAKWSASASAGRGPADARQGK